MPRKTSVKTLKKKADTMYSKAVRLRHADDRGMVTCITCKTRKPLKQMQNGHFVSRRVNALRYDDENCNPQCYSCNVMKYGDQFAYAKELDLLYGDGTAERLHARRFETHKFTIGELEQIIESAKEEIKHYEKEIRRK